MRNPFEITTPETMSAQDIYELFVDVFSDFYEIPRIGHTFLHGYRGSGKSMMFRYMLPDCQKIAQKCALKDLDYFSFYVPIKLTDLNYPEYEKLKEGANNFINEHILTTFVASKCFKNLLSILNEEDLDDTELASFYKEFLWLTNLSGYNVDEFENKKFEKKKDYINTIVKIIDKLYIECKTYCKNIAINPHKNEEYKGALCNFLDFLLPLFKVLKGLTFMPKNSIFILIDDAGYLNETQTKILNTWVSYRSTEDICLKISTQLDYKNYKTVTNKTIDSPHDYSSVNIAEIYTTSKNDYYKKIKDIVKRRIKLYLEKDVDAESFFPTDKEQEKIIEEIKTQIESENYDENRKHRGGDFARRFATSEFYKTLKGNSSTYSYAGFENLVNISSGIIRHFLEPATKMFAECNKNSNIKEIEFIPDSIQNEKINEYSKRFLAEEFTKIHNEHGSIENNEKLSKADKLYNLINGMGQLFKKIFMSDRSERIVFSIALYDLPDKELEEIINLAVHYGYIHMSIIGNKQGTGRNKLYILSRTLAPYFKLDPNGFKGYRFMRSEKLKIALSSPDRFVNEIFNEKEDDNLIQTTLDF